jgi:hypothetical protein
MQQAKCHALGKKRERDMVSIVGDGAQEVMRTDGYETVTWKKREELW